MKNYSKLLLLIALSLVLLPACKLQKDEVPVGQKQPVETATETTPPVVIPDKVEPSVSTEVTKRPVGGDIGIDTSNKVFNTKMPEIEPISDDNSGTTIAASVIPCESLSAVAEIERCKAEEYLKAKGVDATVTDSDIALLLSAFLPIGAADDESPEPEPANETRGVPTVEISDEDLLDKPVELDLSKCDLLSMPELQNYCRESVKFRSDPEASRDAF